MIDWGVGANQVSAVDVPIADGGSIITATEAEGALQEHRTAINLNTAKVISDVAYDAGTWDANADAASKNAIRDKIEQLGGGGTDLGWFIAGEEGGATDTQKIQAAVDAAELAGGGTVYIGLGTWTVTSSIVVDEPSIFIVGAGQRVTNIQRTTDYGNTFTFATGAASILQKGGISNLSIIQATNRMTSGAHIELRYTYNFTVTDVECYSGWIGIAVYGQTSMVIMTRIEIYYAAPYSAANKAHAGIAFYEGAYGTGCPIAMIVESNIKGNGTFLTYNVLIESADGLWFSNVHFGRALYNVYIDGASNDMLAGLKFVNCWFDSATVTNGGLYGVYITGTATVFSLLQFDACFFQGYYMGVGFYIASGSNVSQINISGCKFYHYKYQSIYILDGTFLSIDDTHIMGSSDAAGDHDSILIGTGVEYFTITNNTIGSTLMGAAGTARYGVNILSGCNNYSVVDNAIRLTTNNAGISDSGGANKRVFGNTTDANPTGS